MRGRTALSGMCRQIPDRPSNAEGTAIVAPISTGGPAYPWRWQYRFQRRPGFVHLIGFGLSTGSAS
jgi:hypothetical protein